MSVTKNPKPKNVCYIADSKTCVVFWGFEQLSSAFGARVMLMQRHVQTAGF